MTPLSRRISE